MKKIIFLLLSMIGAGASYANIEIDEASSLECICEGQEQQAIVLIAYGDAEPFTFQWAGPNGYTSTQQSPDDISEAGLYTVIVTNAFGCEVELSKEVEACKPLELNGLDNAIHHPSECGAMDGGVRFFTQPVLGGVSPYEMTLFDEQGMEIEETPFGWANMGAGNYTFEIIDAIGCTLEVDFRLLEQDGSPMVADFVFPACIGFNNGSIVLFTYGLDVEAYQYKWSTGETYVIDVNDDVELLNLATGEYCVTISGVGITDESCVYEDCYYVGQVESEDNLMIDNVDYSPLICVEAPYSGYIRLDVSGGLPFYAIETFNNDYEYQWSTNGTRTSYISNLTEGIHCVTVTDYCGRTVTDCFEIEFAPEIVLNTTSMRTCYDQNTGWINLTASGGIPPLTYQWNDSNSSTTQDINHLYPGIYTVTVTDGLGCEKKLTTAVGSFPQISGNLIVTNECEPYRSGAINIQMTGGDGPFSFAWSTGSTVQNIGGLSPGLYAVTITDVHGCEVAATAAVLNGRTTSPNTDPCGTNVYCDGAFQELIPFTGNIPCGFNNPASCRIRECTCPLTGQVIPSLTTVFNYTSVSLNPSTCELIGTCPTGGTEIAATGSAGTLNSLGTNGDLSCPSCFAATTCDFGPPINLRIVTGASIPVGFASSSGPHEEPFPCSNGRACTMDFFCGGEFMATICWPCSMPSSCFSSLMEDGGEGIIELPDEFLLVQSEITKKLYLIPESELLSLLKSPILDEKYLYEPSNLIFSRKKDEKLLVNHQDYKLELFPNPTSENIVIEFDENVLMRKNIELFNSFGELIFNKKINLNNEQKMLVELDNYGLKSGVYFIKVTLVNGEIISKPFVYISD